jgi:hypothetical protein|tara:strand:- start:82 stop:201 length:120 start_codon:yes stop_codon:yes gene_type:complete
LVGGIDEIHPNEKEILINNRKEQIPIETEYSKLLTFINC